MGVLSLLLFAAGAILYFAVETTVSGLDLAMVGVILMIVGAVGVVLSLLRGTMVGWSSSKTRRSVSADGRTVVEESQIH